MPILTEYRKFHPDDMSSDAWVALPNHSNDDITITIENDSLMKVDFHPSDPMSRRRPRELDVTKKHFRTLFFRAKVGPKIR